MIDKICNYILKRIRKEMPEVDDERAEVILYGLQLIIGEIPKEILLFVIAYFLGIFKLTLISVLIVAPYRCFSGGIHLHTHIGCIICTCMLYIGTALIGKYVVLVGTTKYLILGLVWLFSSIMVMKYAPADTENVPILRKKERTQKKIISEIVLSINIIIALFINNTAVTSMVAYGLFIQTLMITRVAYKLTKNKYGHEVYANS